MNEKPFFNHMYVTRKYNLFHCIARDGDHLKNLTIFGSDLVFYAFKFFTNTDFDAGLRGVIIFSYLPFNFNQGTYNTTFPIKIETNNLFTEGPCLIENGFFCSIKWAILLLEG